MSAQEPFLCPQHCALPGSTPSGPSLLMHATPRCLHLQAGAGFWLTEPSVAKQQAEALARWQYSKAKDPHDCALLYLALGRKAVLQGLFKSAGEGLGRSLLLIITMVCVRHCRSHV